MECSPKKLSIHQLLELAKSVAHEYFAGEVEPIMLACVAYIESGGDPSAVRYEEHLGTSSVGLCQTMLLTARWLVTDTTPKLPAHLLKCRPVGAPVPRPPEIAEPSQLSLMDPFTAMWYGAAYLQHLSVYGYLGRPEEWIIRAYNAGPTGVQWKDTNWYWEKYVRVKQVVIAALVERTKGGGLLQVQAGDTMWSIAKGSGIDFGVLVAYNPQVTDAHKLETGQLLVIPAVSPDDTDGTPGRSSRGKSRSRSLRKAASKSRSRSKSQKRVASKSRSGTPVRTPTGNSSSGSSPPGTMTMSPRRELRRPKSRASLALEEEVQRSRLSRSQSRPRQGPPRLLRGFLELVEWLPPSIRRVWVPAAAASAAVCVGLVAAHCLSPSVSRRGGGAGARGTGKTGLRFYQGTEGGTPGRSAPEGSIGSRSSSALPSSGSDSSKQGSRSGSSFHTLRDGQTLYSVAREHEVSVSSLLSKNPALRQNPNLVKAGTRIAIP